MSTPSRIHVEDVGTEIILDCGTDVSGLTLAKIKYRKPDGTEGEWMAEAKDGEVNQITYVTKQDEETEEYDLDVSGVWYLQAYIETETWTGHGERVSMRVFSTL